LVVLELDNDWPTAGLALAADTLVVTTLDKDWRTELDKDWGIAELKLEPVNMELDTDWTRSLLSLWCTLPLTVCNSSIIALSRFFAEIKRTFLEAKRSSSSRLLDRWSKSPGDINEIIFYNRKID